MEWAMLTFEEYRQYDMLGLAGLVRAGDISAAELLEVAIAAIDRINPRINAVNRDMRDEARATVQAGVPGAIAFAEQIVKVEAYRPDDSFSDALKGLHVYGAKVIRPDAAAVMTASKT
jgi:Asp-tRNA(Asn)/Glu-tRNA(Gln) amidotransferase A subunit family amidase